MLRQANRSIEEELQSGLQTKNPNALQASKTQEQLIEELGAFLVWLVQ